MWQILRRCSGGPHAHNGSALSIPATGHESVARLALLRAVGAALVAGVAWGNGIPYPQWAVIVVILSVRPEEMTALRLTTQRVAETVLPPDWLLSCCTRSLSGVARSRGALTL